MKGINFIVEGIEYKLFEDLYVNKESIVSTPHNIKLDNSLKNEYPKLIYFLKPV